MPDVTITFTAAEIAHLIASRDSHNAQQGTSLTTKQYGKGVLKLVVKATLTRDAAEAERATKESEVNTDWPD